MLAGVGENSMSSFDRMKEKVEQLETQVRGFTYFQGSTRLEGLSFVRDSVGGVLAHASNTI